MKKSLIGIGIFLGLLYAAPIYIGSPYYALFPEMNYDLYLRLQAIELAADQCPKITQKQFDSCIDSKKFAILAELRR